MFAEEDDDELGVGFGAFNLPANFIRVKKVLPDSWGEEVGIEVGDHVKAINGKPISKFKVDKDISKALEKRPMDMKMWGMA